MRVYRLAPSSTAVAVVDAAETDNVPRTPSMTQSAEMTAPRLVTLNPTRLQTVRARTRRGKPANSRAWSGLAARKCVTYWSDGANRLGRLECLRLGRHSDPHRCHGRRSAAREVADGPTPAARDDLRLRFRQG